MSFLRSTKLATAIKMTLGYLLAAPQIVLAIVMHPFQEPYVPWQDR